MNKAIFLDRDGVLNHDEGYTYKTQDLKLLPGVIDGLSLLKSDYLFFIVSNQSGIGRGYYALDDVDKFHKKLLEELDKHEIIIKKIYICPHKPDDNCNCRKPKTKSIRDAEIEFNLDIKNSYVIGDKMHDIELGENAGSKTILVLTGNGDKTKGAIKPDYTAKDLLDAAHWIIEHDK